MRFTTPSGDIDLKKYIKMLIRSYKESILAAREALGFNLITQKRFGRGYITEHESDKMIVYNNRSKYLWHGIIYRITVDFPHRFQGEYLYGFSTIPLYRRWEKYVLRALDPDLKNRDIHKAILDFIKDFGIDEYGEFLIDEDGNYNIESVLNIVDNAFKREVVEVHFDDNLMRQREDDLIIRDNTIENGLNTYRGGGGGGTIDLSMFEIVKNIAFGLSEREIHKIIVKKYDIRISRTTLRNRINDFWGSWFQAKKNFLKPIIEVLVKAGFKKKEIDKAFGKAMDNNYLTLFGRRTYNDLVNLIKEGHMDWQLLPDIIKISNLNEKEYNIDIPFDVLEAIILESLSLRAAARNPLLSGYTKETLNEQINKHWKSFNDARLKLIRPRIIKMLRNNIKGEDLFFTFGYSESTAKTKHNAIMRNMFSGMNTEQARLFFSTHTLQDFKDLYEI